MSNKPACFIVAAAAFAFTAAAPAHAQNARTWVSGTGDDISANCARTAPCKTFAGAISKTLAGGEINCLDPSGYGAVTITKSLTIDCHDVMGSVLQNVAGNAISINLDSASNMIVRLRNLNINGVLTGTRGISIVGTSSTSANNAVSIEDCVIDGFTDFGIYIGSTMGGRLLVRNTTVRNNFGSAISSAAMNSQTQAITRITFDNVTAYDSNFGFSFATGAQAIIKNSISAGNASAGVEADSGAVVAISSSTISGNVTGIQAGAGSTVRVRDSDITFNTTGLSGTIQSYVNNGIFNNGAGGTIVPVAGGVTNPQGLM
jgi:hypothetical protein